MRRPAQSTQLPRPPASTPDASNIGLPLGVILLWLLLAAAAVGVLVIYWRTPVVELYHVTASGPREGVRRMLSFAGYPAALVAAAIALLVADRLHVRTVLLASVGTVVLGASALWAGTTDEADVDTRPVSIAALAGLAISISLSGLLARRLGVVSLRHESGDRRRLVAGLLVLVLALPWIAALLGLSLDRVPLLGSIYLTDVKATQPGNPKPFPAVHDGHHHGLDGAILVWAALILSRELRRFRWPQLRAGMCALLAFFLAYGSWNIAQDFWLEQVVKRGTVSAEIPYAIVPAPTAAWALIAIGSVAAFTGLHRTASATSRSADTRS